MPLTQCILLGAGGHGRMLISLFPAGGAAEIVGVLDSQFPKIRDVDGLPVLGNDDQLAPLIARGGMAFVVGVGSVRNCCARVNLFERVKTLGGKIMGYRHESAYVNPRATLDDTCQVFPKSVINAHVRLQENVLVNSGAIIEHDSLVGSHSHIATGAVLCGETTIGEATHVGAGAIIRQGIQIGSRCLIGAGAVVLADIPDDTTVWGVPARCINRSK